MATRKTADSETTTKRTTTRKTNGGNGDTAKTNNYQTTGGWSDAKVQTSTHRPEMTNASNDERRRMIAEAAYYRAERRGFRNGDPAQDWIEAEHEVDAILAGKNNPRARQTNYAS